MARQDRYRPTLRWNPGRRMTKHLQERDGIFERGVIYVP